MVTGYRVTTAEFIVKGDEPRSSSWLVRRLLAATLSGRKAPPLVTNGQVNFALVLLNS